jgi:hypothetical protein
MCREVDHGGRRRRVVVELRLIFPPHVDMWALLEVRC